MLKENVGCWLYNECNHIDCDHFCLRRFKLSHLYDNACISEKDRAKLKLFLDKDLADKDIFNRLHEIETTVREYVSAGNNLYLYSSICGCGKTSWALRLAQAFLNRTWFTKSIEDTPVLFIAVPKFLLALKDNISEKSSYVAHIKKTVLEADLVIFDDIATKSTTQFESENLLSIIDQRIALGKSSIFTSNLTREELQQALGDRLTSRIFNYSECLQFKGKDKRALKQGRK